MRGKAASRASNATPQRRSHQGAPSSATDPPVDRSTRLATAGEDRSSRIQAAPDNRARCLGPHDRKDSPMKRLKWTGAAVALLAAIPALAQPAQPPAPQG